MKRYASSIKVRLIVLMLLVLLPVLLAVVLFASNAYRLELRTVERNREALVTDFSMRSRIWLRGATRTLVALQSGLTQRQNDDTDCRQRLSAVLGLNQGFLAAMLSGPAGSPCVAIAGEILSREDLTALAAAQRQLPLPAATGASGHRARYDSLTRDGRHYLTIYIRSADPATSGEAVAVLTPDTLDAAFDLGPLDHAVVGLVGSQGGLLTMRGLAVETGDWIPAALPRLDSVTLLSTSARDGSDGVYALSPIANSDLVVVARFTGTEMEDAHRKFLITLITPLLVGLLLSLAYVFALKRDVFRWINAIKETARARIENAASRRLVSIPRDMPRELAEVATAINAMVADATTRESRLAQTLADNQSLMRELHHRVKNSLQVIQSYLSLAQREADEKRRAELADIEARVFVLSIAYRLALAEDGMRTVPMRALAEELIGNISNSIRQNHQWVTLTAEVDGALNVDRAIPFGLAIVEGVIAALRGPGCITAAVELTMPMAKTYDLIVRSDARTYPGPNRRVMQGLALQLRAVADEPKDKILFHWRFTVD